MTVAEDLARIYDRKEHDAIAANRQREQRVHGPYAESYYRPTPRRRESQHSLLDCLAVAVFLVTCIAIAIAWLWSLGQ